MNPANWTVEEIAEELVERYDSEPRGIPAAEIADALRAEREQTMLTPAFLSQMAASAGDCKKEDLEKIRATILHFVHVVTVQDNELRAQLAAERQAHGDLLAVIHGDGGHYIEEHGWEKAQTDAVDIVYKLKAERERGESKSLEVIKDLINVPHGASTYEMGRATAFADAFMALKKAFAIRAKPEVGE